MSVLTPDRAAHLAHLITNAIWDDDLVDFTDDDTAMRLAKAALVQFIKEDQDIDAAARAKVASLKRNVIEGSPEWDVMYRKYYEEETQRRGR